MKNQLEDKILELSQKERKIRALEYLETSSKTYDSVSMEELNKRIFEMETALNDAAMDNRKMIEMERENSELRREVQNLQKIIAVSEKVKNYNVEV